MRLQGNGHSQALLDKVENLYNPCVGTLEISSKNFLVPTFHIFCFTFLKADCFCFKFLYFGCIGFSSLCVGFLQLWEPLFVMIHGLLIAMASLIVRALACEASIVVAHRLSCSTACGIFWTRD